jgi:hypothetical protein
MALDATPGGAAANSYCSLTEANAYHASRLFVASWTAATDAVKEAALQEACRLLDSSFDWTGGAASATQALCWPRVGMVSLNKFAIPTTTIPAQLKNAQAEFARQLIDGDRTADNDAVKNELTSVKAGSVALSFRDTEGGSTVETKDGDIRRKGPDFDYLAKWIPDAVRNLLVKSWYQQPVITQGLVFQSLGGPE